MINYYWYDGQLRSYMLQFANIFTGMQVLTGKGEDGQETTLAVPVFVGNRDRVVAAIGTGNAKNRSFTLPCMAIHLQGIDLTPERRHGVNQVDRRVTMPATGVFPDDLKVVRRVMPIPYDLQFELSIYASNTQQMHQILEQILVLFDPSMDLQTSDANFDWTKLTKAELIGITNEENYPIGNDRRVIIWTLNFVVNAWLSVPMDVRDDIVKKVIIRISEMDTTQVFELNEAGEATIFGDELARVEINEQDAINALFPNGVPI